MDFLGEKLKSYSTNQVYELIDVDKAIKYYDYLKGGIEHDGVVKYRNDKGTVIIRIHRRHKVINYDKSVTVFEPKRRCEL